VDKIIQKRRAAILFRIWYLLRALRVSAVSLDRTRRNRTEDVPAS